MNVAALGVRGELTCNHIFDHTMMQRTDSLVSLMASSILSEIDDASILRLSCSIIPYVSWLE